MTNILNEVLQLLPIILTALGLLAFVLSVIVEVTKELPGIKNIPTKLWTIILSIVLCILVYLAIASYLSWVITWYFIFSVVIASLIVAFIATYGWENFNELYNRFKR